MPACIQTRPTSLFCPDTATAAPKQDYSRVFLLHSFSAFWVLLCDGPLGSHLHATVMVTLNVSCMCKCFSQDFCKRIWNFIIPKPVCSEECTLTQKAFLKAWMLGSGSETGGKQKIQVTCDLYIYEPGAKNLRKRIIGMIFQLVGTAAPVVPYICQLVKKHHTSVREVSLPEWESGSVSA